MDVNKQIAAMVGTVGCILLAVNAYCNFTVADKMNKMQTAAQIFIEADECQARCPAYQSGHMDTASGKWIDSNNSDHDKCAAECVGSERAKLKALVFNK